MRYLSLCALFLLVVSTTWIDRHLFKANESFSPYRVLANWHYFPKYETTLAEPLGILDQSFTYLTKGKQSFVFVSEDGEWVLKLFRLPSKARGKGAFGKTSGLTYLDQTVRAFYMATEELSSETQVTFSHLSPKKIDTPFLVLMDHSGTTHYLSTQYLPFVLQRKGDLFFNVFDQIENKKALIDQTISFFSIFFEKGFIDHDPILEKNFGFVGKTPFLMDVGQISIRDPSIKKRDYLHAMTHSLRLKLNSDYPHLLPYYEKKLQEK